MCSIVVLLQVVWKSDIAGMINSEMRHNDLARSIQIIDDVITAILYRLPLSYILVTFTCASICAPDATDAFLEAFKALRKGLLL